MKKNLLNTIFILMTFFSFGQIGEIETLLKKSLKYRTEFDSGVFYANEAMLLSREFRFEEGMNLSKMYAGVSYFNADEVDTATTLLYDALPHLDGLDFETGLTHWYIGKIHKSSQNLQNAEDHFLKAKEAFEKTDSTTFLGNIYNSIGIIHGMQTNYNEALSWFTKVYQLKLEKGAIKETSAELSNISMVYTRMGSYRKAIEYVWQAIDLVEGDNDSPSYSTLGAAYNLMGKPDSAMIYYQISLDTAKKYGHKRHLTSAIINLSNIHYQKEEYRKSIASLKKILKMWGKKSNYLFASYTELGKSYRNLKMYDSAIFYLQQGFQLSKTEKNRVWAKESATFLGYLFADQDQYDSAFHYLTQTLAYKDSLNGARVQEIFANQRVALETAKKQHEIEVLQKENEVNTYKQKMLVSIGVFSLVIALLGFLYYRSRQMLAHKMLSEEKTLLERALEKSKAELTAHTLNMIHRKNGMDEIEEHVNKLEGHDKQKIKRIINVNKALEKDWENFKKYFSQVHADFFENLRREFPLLSQNEIRLSALIKMNLANHEIATLLNIESKSVRMARYRLKKKLVIDEETDLNHFLHRL